MESSFYECSNDFNFSYSKEIVKGVLGVTSIWDEDLNRISWLTVLVYVKLNRMNRTAIMISPSLKME